MTQDKKTKTQDTEPKEGALSTAEIIEKQKRGAEC